MDVVLEDITVKVGGGVRDKFVDPETGTKKTTIYPISQESKPELPH